MSGLLLLSCWWMFQALKICVHICVLQVLLRAPGGTHSTSVWRTWRKGGTYITHIPNPTHAYSFPPAIQVGSNWPCCCRVFLVLSHMSILFPTKLCSYSTSTRPHNHSLAYMYYICNTCDIVVLQCDLYSVHIIRINIYNVNIITNSIGVCANWIIQIELFNWYLSGLWNKLFNSKVPKWTLVEITFNLNKLAWHRINLM
jgi:hypothetical protein